MKQYYIGLILFSSVSSVYSYAHTQLLLENNCSSKAKFTITGALNKNVYIDPGKYTLVKNINNDKFWGSADKYYISYNNQEGSVEFALHNMTINTIHPGHGGNDSEFTKFRGGMQVQGSNNYFWDTWTNKSASGKTKTRTYVVTSCGSGLQIDDSLLRNKKRVLIFSDSLSDEGLFYSNDGATLPLSTPYSNGMFTNGIVWSRHLRSHVQRYNMEVSNYSVGGATIQRYVPWTDISNPYSLKDEINVYLADSKSFKEAPNERLAIVFMGANDYLTTQLTKLEKKKYTVEEAVDETVKSLQSSIDKISQTSSEVLVIGLPDLSKNLGSIISSNNTYLTSEMSQLHNEKMKQYADEKGFIFLDVNEVFQELFDDVNAFNQKYGTHIQEKNIFSYNAFNPKSCKDDSYMTESTPCVNPEDFVFWDYVHPTHQIHKILYSKIIESLGAEVEK